VERDRSLRGLSLLHDRPHNINRDGLPETFPPRGGKSSRESNSPSPVCGGVFRLRQRRGTPGLAFLFLQRCDVFLGLSSRREDSTLLLFRQNAFFRRPLLLPQRASLNALVLRKRSIRKGEEHSSQVRSSFSK